MIFRIQVGHGMDKSLAPYFIVGLLKFKKATTTTALLGLLAGSMWWIRCAFCWIVVFCLNPNCTLVCVPVLP